MGANVIWWGSLIKRFTIVHCISVYSLNAAIIAVFVIFNIYIYLWFKWQISVYYKYGIIHMEKYDNL